MVDPLSVIASVGSIAGSCATTLKALHTAQEKWKLSNLTFDALAAECALIGTSLGSLETIMRRRLAPGEAALPLDPIERALCSCVMITTTITTEVNKIATYQEPDGTLSSRGKALLLLGESNLKELLSQARSLKSGISDIVRDIQGEALQTRMNDMADVLRTLCERSKTTYQRNHPGSRAPLNHLDARSIISSEMDRSSVLSGRRFQFDDEIVSADAYRRALAQALNHPGSSQDAESVGTGKHEGYLPTDSPSAFVINSLAANSQAPGSPSSASTSFGADSVFALAPTVSASVSSSSSPPFSTPKGGPLNEIQPTPEGSPASITAPDHQLHHAIRTGNLPVALNLLRTGADVNELDGRGRSPLHLCALAEDKPEWMASCLIEYQANVNLHSCQYMGSGIETSPLTLAAMHGRLGLVKVLLEAGGELSPAESRQCLSPLHAALMGRNPNVASFLASRGASWSSKSPVPFKDGVMDGCYPFQTAILVGMPVSQDMLGDIGLAARSKGGLTAFSFAVVADDTSALDQIHERGVVPSKSDIDLITTLPNSASVHFLRNIATMQSRLGTCIESGSVDQLRGLVAEDPECLALPVENKPPIMQLILARRSGDAETLGMAEYMLQARPKCVDETGVVDGMVMKPLHLASYTGKWALITLLRDHGAKVDDFAGTEFRTPLMCCLIGFQKYGAQVIAAAKTLFDVGAGEAVPFGHSTQSAVSDARGWEHILPIAIVSSLLHVATKHRRYSIAELLVQYPETNVDAADANHDTALFTAVSQSDARMVSIILSSLNIDVNRSPNGRSLIAEAVRAGDKKVLELLLARKDLALNAKDTLSVFRVLESEIVGVHNRACASTTSSNDGQDKHWCRQSEFPIPLTLENAVNVLLQDPRFDLEAVDGATGHTALTKAVLIARWHPRLVDLSSRICRRIISSPRFTPTCFRGQQGSNAALEATKRGLLQVVRDLIRHPKQPVTHWTWWRCLKAAVVRSDSVLILELLENRRYPARFPDEPPLLLFWLGTEAASFYGGNSQEGCLPGLRSIAPIESAIEAKTPGLELLLRHRRTCLETLSLGERMGFLAKAAYHLTPDVLRNLTAEAGRLAGVERTPRWREIMAAVAMHRPDRDCEKALEVILGEYSVVDGIVPVEELRKLSPGVCNLAVENCSLLAMALFAGRRAATRRLVLGGADVRRAAGDLANVKASSSAIFEAWDLLCGACREVGVDPPSMDVLKSVPGYRRKSLGLGRLM
ncbi:uncharacterized protein MKZ38_002267 [Zalerion maritima]|uniref:Ankyrin repeat protein n=1 Tax=Zalerion maritima TaxID=339359 RepID=A0AAD5WSI9_9PEZI|nr:uncharacterized protein MKZ38_002267 [Zalerion maritima]